MKKNGRLKYLVFVWNEVPRLTRAKRIDECDFSKPALTQCLKPLQKIHPTHKAK
jgi:hypothetical protein